VQCRQETGSWEEASQLASDVLSARLAEDEEARAWGEELSGVTGVTGVLE